MASACLATAAEAKERASATLASEGRSAAATGLALVARAVDAAEAVATEDGTSGGVGDGGGGRRVR